MSPHFVRIDGPPCPRYLDLAYVVFARVTVDAEGRGPVLDLTLRNGLRESVSGPGVANVLAALEDLARLAAVPAPDFAGAPLGHENFRLLPGERRGDGFEEFEGRGPSEGGSAP